LRSIAACCRRNLRAADLLGRYGGEEFSVLLPVTDLAGATEVAERLRASVAACPLSDRHPQLRVTLSLGVAQAGVETADLSGLLKRADAALYEAKTGGRNRVVVARDSQSDLECDVSQRRDAACDVS
jgi:diguanylate cyclase (GGDEF)-like protein